MIIAPHSDTFPAVLFCSSIKCQFHVKISKIMSIETLVKWDVLDLFKLIRCIFVFKSMIESMRFLRKIIVYALRDRTQHGHVKLSFST